MSKKARAGSSFSRKLINGDGNAGVAINCNIRVEMWLRQFGKLKIKTYMTYMRKNGKSSLDHRLLKRFFICVSFLRTSNFSISRKRLYIRPFVFCL